MISLQNSDDISSLIEDIGDASVVMLGEASHGTHEYYTWRAAISKMLITRKGFSFIAVEGDWPDCYRLNRFIKDIHPEEENIHDVLQNFNRWPSWMWANWEIAAFGEWLKKYNGSALPKKKIGFYGLDVYSLWESMEAIVNYLDKEYPSAAAAARKAIACFEPYEEEGQLYAQAVSIIPDSCRDSVMALLREIRKNAAYYNGDEEAALNTEQNALIAVNAERYYRSMISFNNESWNIRDTHMMETLDRLLEFHGTDAKAIVWEHNTHIGDARATNMKKSGMVNLGQLAREEYGKKEVYLLGFGSYEGSVIAGEEWGAPMKIMKVPPARKNSVEEILHRENTEAQLLLFSDPAEYKRYSSALPHRAIGVVYNPQQEKFGNYVHSIMAERYNGFIFLDKTTALHPLHMEPDGAQMPETYPFGV